MPLIQLGLDLNLVKNPAADVDEVGRGPLCGPVVTAMVIFDPNRPIPGLNDSKRLNEARREVLFGGIRGEVLAWCIAHAEVEKTGRLNTLHTIVPAMQHAVEGLSVTPQLVLIGGSRCLKLTMSSAPMIKDDGQVLVIAVASILAKVSRDQEMIELDRAYPGYGIVGHKGYPTTVHLEAPSRLDLTPIHRRSFIPAHELLNVSVQQLSGCRVTDHIYRLVISGERRQ